MKEYNAILERINYANDLKTLDRLSVSIDLIYNCGLLTGHEVVALDNILLDRYQEIELLK